MKNLTEVVFILDKSGSMNGYEDDTIGGFNSTIEKQKSVDGEVLVSTVLFSTSFKVVYDRVPLSEVKPMTRKDYEVGGCTALLDAIGRSIRHIKNVQKYAREEDKPDKTLFVIITDGYENSSHEFDYADIKKLIGKYKEKGWEFIFLAADIDAVQVAGSIGIASNRAVNFHKDRRGSERSYGAVAQFMSSFAAAPFSAAISDDWREEVDEDFKSRKADKDR